MAETKVPQLQIDPMPYAGGTLSSENGITYKIMYEQFNYGITKTDTTTYTVTQAGIYYIHFQQLINSNTNSPYLMLRINNTTVKQAWQVASHMEDMVVSDLRALAVGDTIRLYQSVSVTNSWGDLHSSYQIFMVRRTA